MNPNLSAATLRRAASILDQIDKLKAEFSSIVDGTAPRRGRKPGRKPGRKAKAAAASEAPAPAKKKRRKKRKLSPEARARIVAAVKARWAREKARK